MEPNDLNSQQHNKTEFYNLVTGVIHAGSGNIIINDMSSIEATLQELLKHHTESRSAVNEQKLRFHFRHVFDLLRTFEIDINIKVRRILGTHLELLYPNSSAIVAAPVFRWTLGQEVMQSCKDVIDFASIAPAITAQVTLLDADRALWISPEKAHSFPLSANWAAEADKVYELACPQHVSSQLQTDRKYQWQLKLSVPIIDQTGQLGQKNARTQASFRILSPAEQEIMDVLLTELPNERNGELVRTLVCGAIYESFGIYDWAVAQYEQGLTQESHHQWIYARLAELYKKRAYDLLGMSDEQPIDEPIPLFASKANEYSKLAASAGG